MTIFAGSYHLTYMRRYQSKFQSVLPFLPTDPMVLQSTMEEASETVQKAFELALRAIHTPVYSGNTVDQARADLIQKSNRSLDKQAHGPLYLATVGVLMLAIQTTGPVSEYKGKLPNMLNLHDKAISAFTALNSFEQTNLRPPEITSYIRCIAIAIRALLLITSVGSGEIFGIIDEIQAPTESDSHILSESAYKFAGKFSKRLEMSSSVNIIAELGEIFHEIFRSGLAPLTIDFDTLNLHDTNLPSPEYKVVVLTLQLLTMRLNTFTDTPDYSEIIQILDNLIDSLYLFTLPKNGAPYAPTCWLYYHGLALAVKTAFDLAATDEIDGDPTWKVAATAIDKLKEIINHLFVDVLSGWEQAAMNTLNSFSTERSEESLSSGKWRDVLVKDAYLRSLDF